PLFGYLIDFISTFRMPAFFVVSGFFCAMFLLRYGNWVFFSSRLKRILLPLLVCAVSLNVLQAMLLKHFGWITEDVPGYLLSGGWVQHLWFLLDLFIFVLLLCLAYWQPTVRRLAQQLNAAIVQRLPLPVFIALLPLCALALAGMNKLGLPMYHSWFGISDLYEILSNLPFFLFGLMLYSSPRWLTQFSNVNLGYALVALALLFAAAYVCDQRPGVAWQALGLYCSLFARWVSVALCFSLFNRLVSSSHHHWQFLSEASYSVYLFHHLIVIALGLWLINAGIPPLPGFSLIVIITLALTLAIHKYLIAPNNTLRLLFNGK
ncbi:MAG TPA: acyltransferase family protein, partial [Rheinheimera sp.]|nr:acyltransferase family protein [Rheinheimera sp.]